MTRPDLSRILAPAVTLALVGLFAIFAHTGLYGERGRGTLVAAEAREADLIAELAMLERHRAALANRTRRLGEDYLDLDLLDERARTVLGHRRPDEITIR